MADPAPGEYGNFTDISKVLDWAGFSGEDYTSEQTPSGTLLQLLGIRPTDHPRVLALIEHADAVAVIQRWKVPLKAADGSVSYVPPTIGDMGKARLVFRTCQVVTGSTETIEDLKKQLAAARATPATTAANQAASSAAEERKVKLSAILSQVDDTEAKVLTEKEMVQAYLRYATVFGEGERPAKESEPTVEQLSAVRHLLANGHPPYCDFSIWGPFGHRLAKKIKLSGYILGRDGLLTSVELTGPSNFGMWLQSWQVFSNVCVMLDIVDLGVLTKYRDLIERFHNRYGQAIWALLYQADNRCRLELAERIRRQILAEEEALKQSHTGGGAPPKVPGFDPKRPWNLVYQRAIAMESYWREEVIEPSILVLTKVSGLQDVVDGDAKIRADSLPSGARDTGPTPSRMVQSQPPAPAAPQHRPRNTNRTGRHHNVKDGKYVMNRTGYNICSAYNEGRCEATGAGGWCPAAWDTVHQCWKCLGQHPATKCPHDSMPQPNFLKSKGKGRGGKGGKKGKGRSAQY